MPADRRGPHLREISREALTEEGGPLGQSGTATCGRASEGTPLSAAVRGLLLLLTAVRSGEGLIAAGSRNGGGCSMLSIGRRSGAAALQWSLSPPGGETHNMCPRRVNHPACPLCVHGAVLSCVRAQGTEPQDAVFESPRTIGDAVLATVVVEGRVRG